MAPEKQQIFALPKRESSFSFSASTPSQLLQGRTQLEFSTKEARIYSGFIQTLRHPCHAFPQISHWSVTLVLCGMIIQLKGPTPFSPCTHPDSTIITLRAPWLGSFSLCFLVPQKERGANKFCPLTSLISFNPLFLKLGR